MKLELENLIERTDQAARAWMLAADDRLSVGNLRPVFVAHRLVCVLSELEELLAVHGSIWPHDQALRLRFGDPSADGPGSTADLIKRGEEVAEEELPEPELALSQNTGELFQFFCQLRKTILFYSKSSDDLLTMRDLGASIDAALKSVRGLEHASRVELEQALSRFIRNSFMHSTARLPNGALLGNRYWPLFRAAGLLQGEAHMRLENVREILDQAQIKPETRELVDQLIDALRQALSEYDIDDIRDILENGGQLPTGVGNYGGIVVLPNAGQDRCAPVVLAIAKGRGSRSRYALPQVMRQIRAHLIQCFEITEVVVLLTDRWDPSLMNESAGDFAAYETRSFGRKLLIPLVSWKRHLTAYEWP